LFNRADKPDVDGSVPCIASLLTDTPSACQRPTISRADRKKADVIKKRKAVKRSERPGGPQQQQQQQLVEMLIYLPLASELRRLLRSMVGRRLITSQDAPVSPPTPSSHVIRTSFQQRCTAGAISAVRTAEFSDFRPQEVILNLRRQADDYSEARRGGRHVTAGSAGRWRWLIKVVRRQSAAADSRPASKQASRGVRPS